MRKPFRLECGEVQVDEIVALREDAKRVRELYSGRDSRLDSVLERAISDPNPNARRLRRRIGGIIWKHPESVKALAEEGLLVSMPPPLLRLPFGFESPGVRDDERDTLNRYIRSRREYFGGLDAEFDSVLDCAQSNLYSSNPRGLRKVIDRAFMERVYGLVEGDVLGEVYQPSLV